MSKMYDVVSLCNALKDIMIEISEEELTNLKLNKGIMHIVSSDVQSQLLKSFEHKNKKEELGGSGLNTIRALALLNTNNAFAGMVGEDTDGKSVVSRLNELKVTHKLRVHDKESTGTCVVLVTPDKERTMHTSLGASSLYDQTLVPDEEIKNSKVFHFCGYQWDTDPQKEAILHAIKIAKASKTLISFDVADPFVVNRHKKDILDIIDSHADIVFANREEAKSLYGEENLKQEAINISKKGTIFIHKKDKDGAEIFQNGTSQIVAAKKADVVDLTAAGDMFAAGFLYGYVKDRPLEVCGEIAALLAADVISQLGASLSDQVIKDVLKI